MLKPDVAAHVYKKQSDQKQYSDKNRHVHCFTIGQEIMAWDFRQGDKWTCGKIIDQLGPVSYLIQCNDGLIWRRHVDHIQQFNVSPQQPDKQTDNVVELYHQIKMELPRIS